MGRKKTMLLDVREDLRRGREPFARIMQAVSSLKEDQDLLLVAPFEPIPLYQVLGAQGFSHEGRQLDSGDWKIRFFRSSSSSPPSGTIQADSETAPHGPALVEVDARGLEPPQPLVKILEAVALLPPGACLRALTDRRPMHLYEQLEQRGFAGHTEQQPNGSFLTEIRHV